MLRDGRLSLRLLKCLLLAAASCPIAELSATGITELLFAASTAPYVVGVSNYSNYPPAAQQIASVGKLGTIEVEKILTLKPHPIVSWQSASTVS